MVCGLGQTHSAVLFFSGVKEDAIETEISYHFDPGYSFGEPETQSEDCHVEQNMASKNSKDRTSRLLRQANRSRGADLS